ncbi:MAG: hypothetical protein EBR93_03250, partial [Bacteroidetes bacterium]|nr:hypothetical protein [Bacteroidota bacterium]
MAHQATLEKATLGKATIDKPSVSIQSKGSQVESFVGGYSLEKRGLEWGFGLMRERLQSVARVSAMLVSMAVLMGVASVMSVTEHVSFVGTVDANDIQVTNTAVADDSEAGVRVVSFDLSWENSWRSADLDGSDDSNAGNWDAAWVFVKYRTAGGAWKHARLTASGHIAGTASGENMGEGAALQVGLVDQSSAYD